MGPVVEASDSRLLPPQGAPVVVAAVVVAVVVVLVAVVVVVVVVVAVVAAIVVVVVVVVRPQGDPALSGLSSSSSPLPRVPLQSHLRPLWQKGYSC